MKIVVDIMNMRFIREDTANFETVFASFVFNITIHERIVNVIIVRLRFTNNFKTKFL